MSFYITVLGGKINNKEISKKDRIAILIKSKNHRLFTYFVPVQANVEWQDAFVAQSSQQQLQFQLIKQVTPNKTAKSLSVGMLNLSKFLFIPEQIKQQITLNKQGQVPDTLTLNIAYRDKKNFIGPIQFYKRGSNDIPDEEGQNIQVQGDSKWGFIYDWFLGKKNTSKISKLNEDSKEQGEVNEHGEIQFYRGPHKNRNLFSLCDQVVDDQKFTVVQDLYRDK